VPDVDDDREIDGDDDLLEVGVPERLTSGDAETLDDTREDWDRAGDTDELTEAATLELLRGDSEEVSLNVARAVVLGEFDEDVVTLTVTERREETETQLVEEEETLAVISDEYDCDIVTGAVVDGDNVAAREKLATKVLLDVPEKTALGETKGVLVPIIGDAVPVTVSDERVEALAQFDGRGLDVDRRVLLPDCETMLDKDENAVLDGVLAPEELNNGERESEKLPVWLNETRGDDEGSDEADGL